MLHLKVTETIDLTALAEQDAAELFQAIDENRQHLRTWIAWIDQIKNEATALDIIKAGEHQSRIQQGMVTGIFKGGKIIGIMEMQDWQHDLKKANIGYWLVKKEEGKGIMYQAAGAFLTYLFQQAGLNKVELVHLPENTRSAALAARLGFKTEGILRDALLMNGRLRDKVVQGLLKQEWLARPETTA